jgi:hypothetical protein
MLGLFVLTAGVTARALLYLVLLDKGANLTEQMTLAGTVGAVNISTTAATNVKFLPAKPTSSSLSALSVQFGFLVADSPGQATLEFAYSTSSGSAQTSGSQTFSLAGADPYYPLYEFDVVTTTNNQAAVIVTNYNPTTISSSQCEELIAPLPSGPLEFPTY